MSKKKYSINWEDDFPSTYEVDGVQYENLEDVPDESDRRKLQAMSDASFMADINAEVEAQRKNSIAPEKIVVWAFSGVAAILLAIALFSSFGVISKVSKEESADGRVVDMIMKVQYYTDEYGNQLPPENFYYPVVEFRSEDGRGHSVQLTEGSSPASYEVGEDVTVLYNPEHPLEARIKSASSTLLQWVLPGITGILGVSFLVAMLAVRKFLF